MGIVNKNIRWEQHFANYRNELTHLQKFLDKEILLIYKMPLNGISFLYFVLEKR